MTTRFAAAKVNLALHVTGRRGDGYHLIETLVAFCDIGDRIRVEQGDEDGLTITGAYAAVLDASSDNLVIRARDALRRHLIERGQAAGPVSLYLTKELPVASGIGGGSADAAATLLALAEHWCFDDCAALGHLAESLGADVPMCLSGRPAIARGVGEQLTAINNFPDLHLVLVNPGVAVSTPTVFAGLDKRDNAPLPDLPARLDAESLADYLADTRNDLAAPAARLTPAIEMACEAITASGAVFTRMSGSGATCFGLHTDAAEAARAARQIADQHPGWFVRATVAGAAPAFRKEPADALE